MVTYKGRREQSGREILEARLPQIGVMTFSSYICKVGPKVFALPNDKMIQHAYND